MMVDPKRIERGLYWGEGLRLVGGCKEKGPSCDNCWARTETRMRSRHPNPKMRARHEGLVGTDGRWTGEIRLFWDDLRKPVGRRKPTAWAIWNDLFHENVPSGFLDEAFGMMEECFWHVFLVCTKRPRRMREYLDRRWTGGFRPQFIWLGVTVESPEYLWRLDEVMAVRTGGPFYVSGEPLLAHVDFWPWLPNPRLAGSGYELPGLGWVIVGGETGARARPCDPEWVRSARNQCRAAGVPLFVKQMARRQPIPEDLSIREIPFLKEA